MALLWLSAELGTGAGDVAGGAEFRPTDAQFATLGELETEVTAARSAFRKFMDNDVKAFNAAMNGKLVRLSDELPKPQPKAVFVP